MESDSSPRPFIDILNYLEKQEVRINGYLLGSIPDLSAGDTVNVSVKVEGTEIMNKSVVIPSAPSISSPNDNYHVASGASLSLTWTGVPPVDEYIVAIDSFDTVSDDGYSAYLSGSATSHTIPGNTLLVSGGFPAYIMVGAANSAQGNGEFLMSGSELIASNIDSVPVYQN